MATDRIDEGVGATKLFPAGIISVVPAVCVRPAELKLPKAVDGLKPAGTSSSELAPMVTASEPQFFQVPAVRSNRPLALKLAGLLPASKTPWLETFPLIDSDPPLKRYSSPLPIER